MFEPRRKITNFRMAELKVTEIGMCLCFDEIPIFCSRQTKDIRYPCLFLYSGYQGPAVNSFPLVKNLKFTVKIAGLGRNYVFLAL